MSITNGQAQIQPSSTSVRVSTDEQARTVTASVNRSKPCEVLDEVADPRRAELPW